MSFAYRVHHAIIELDPGQTATYRLPPMTPGMIVINAKNATVPQGPPVPREEGGQPISRRGRHGAPDRLPAEESAPQPSEVARDSSIRGGHHIWGTGLLGDAGLPPDGGVGGGASGLTMELLLGGNVVATHFNHIGLNTPNSGDVWTLRTSRKTDDGVSGKRRYLIEAQYPSVLPLEERRISIDLIQRGFDANWNGHEYILAAEISANKLFYTWDHKFADLYGLPWDGEPIELASTEWIELPYIRKDKITFSAGGGPDPNPVPPIPGEVRGERPFFAMLVECKYEGSREADLRWPAPNITLPDRLWFELKFFIIPWVNGGVGYIPKVSSPLLDALDVTISYPSLDGTIHSVNLKAWITEKLETYLYRLQMRETGNAFDRYIHPWMVGRYDIENVAYLRDRNEMIFTYVGRLPLRSRMVEEISTVVGDEQPQQDFPPLFDTPQETPANTDVGLPEHGLLHATSPGALAKIDHIVVLMQENRSFDQVLGYLSRDAGHAEVEGLLPGDNNRDRIVFQDREYRSRRTTTTAWPSFTIPNPCHDHACAERQIADGMKGAVADFAKRLRKAGCETPENLQRIMDYYTDAELPTYRALVREFAICDHWFSAHLGPTLPNRFVTLTGDLNLDSDGLPEVENADLGDYAPTELPSFFDHLTDRGVTWKVFDHGYGFLRLFRGHTFDVANIAGFNDAANGFEATVRAGLPQVTFIEPDYIEAPDGNDDHAPADMMNGQRLIAKIVRTLIEENPSQWAKTLFIVTYDEHGGFYDHLLPPDEIEDRQPDGSVTRRPIPPLRFGGHRLGVRVPAFVVSPYIPKGENGVNVSHTIFDHTTIAATILRRFCSPHPPRMSPRADNAADLRDLLTLDEPRPRSDFDALVAELRRVEGLPGLSPTGVIDPVPMRVPHPDPNDPEDHTYLEDFHGFMAYASSVTGLGPR
jgi:phospholipase C